jgi:hypothetical protein
MTPSGPSAGCEWWLVSAAILALIAINWATMEGTSEGHGPSLPFEIDEVRGVRRAGAGALISPSIASSTPDALAS